MLLSVNFETMPALDVAMPIALLITIVIAMFLNKRVEGKLMATVEEKEFKTRDILLLVVFIAVMISVIAYTSIINPGGITQNILLVLFLSSYTMLLFTFTYVFSNLTKVRAQLLSVGFGTVGLVAGLASFLAPLTDSYTIYRVAAFFIVSAFCFGAAVYEQKKAAAPVKKGRWYLAVQPAAIFILLFIFFNFLYGGSVEIWQPYLMDVFGFTFAILIILYLSSMFTWKTVGLFAALLTIHGYYPCYRHWNHGYCSSPIYRTWFACAGLLTKRTLPILSRGRFAKQRSWFRRLLLCRHTLDSNLQEIRPKNRINLCGCYGSCVWHLGSIPGRHLGGA